jgi:hypothetical protein
VWEIADVVVRSDNLLVGAPLPYGKEPSSMLAWDVVAGTRARKDTAMKPLADGASTHRWACLLVMRHKVASPSSLVARRSVALLTRSPFSIGSR